MQTAGGGVTDMLAGLSIGSVVLGALLLTLIRIPLTMSKHPFARSIADFVESIVAAGIFVFLLIRPFLAQAFYIPTPSMEPTLLGHQEGMLSMDGIYTDTVHDHFFANKLIYRLRDPQHGDIVVFNAPKAADREGGFQHERALIKRVIGTPGDTIYIHDGEVYRNGKALNEPVCGPGAPTPCIAQKVSNPQPGEAIYGVTEPLKLGKDQYFMMGDNRNNSSDSRYWGIVTRNRIVGRADLLFWPLSRAGRIR